MLEKRMLGPGMEICALKRGTGRQSKEFTQGLPTTSSVGWLLLVHVLCILQTQPREEGAVGLSCESSFLGGSADGAQHPPLGTQNPPEVPQGGTPGQDHTSEAALLFACLWAPKCCLKLEAEVSQAQPSSFPSQSPREVQVALTKTKQTCFENS